MLGGFQAAAARVVLGLEDEGFVAGIRGAEAEFVGSISGMSIAAQGMAEAQLRSSVAADRYNMALRESGPASVEARAALANLIAEQRALAISQDAGTASTGRFERGMVAAGSQGLGFGRAMTFASNAFIGGAGLVYAIDSAVKSATKFQGEMVLLQTQALATHKEVSNMSTALLKLAPSLATSPDTLAAGLYHVESAGIRGAKALQVLTIAAKGARLGHADLEQVTTALVAAQKSGISGAQNLTKAMGTLDAIIGSGNTRMEDLSKALSTGVLSSAKAFGISLSQLGGALSTLTVQGQPAEIAATRLRYSIALLGSQTPKAETQLKSIGLTVGQLGAQMRSGGLISALDLLRSKLIASGENQNQWNRILQRSFGGGRSFTTIVTLLQNLDMLKAKTKEIQEQSGQFGARWVAQTKTAEYAFASLGASADVMKIRLGDALLPPTEKIAKNAAAWLGQTKNQVRMTNDLMAAYRDAAAAAGAFGTGVHQLGEVLHVTDQILGGSGKTLKALLELMVIRKLLAFGKSIRQDFITPIKEMTGASKSASAAVSDLIAKSEKAAAASRAMNANPNYMLRGNGSWMYPNGTPDAGTQTPVAPWNLAAWQRTQDEAAAEEAKVAAAKRATAKAQTAETVALQTGAVETQDQIAGQKQLLQDEADKQAQLGLTAEAIQAELDARLLLTKEAVDADAQLVSADAEVAAGLEQVAEARAAVNAEPIVSDAPELEAETKAAVDLAAALDDVAAAEERVNTVMKGTPGPARAARRAAIQTALAGGASPSAAIVAARGEVQAAADAAVAPGVPVPVVSEEAQKAALIAQIKQGAAAKAAAEGPAIRTTGEILALPTSAAPSSVPTTPFDVNDPAWIQAGSRAVTLGGASIGVLQRELKLTGDAGYSKAKALLGELKRRGVVDDFSKVYPGALNQTGALSAVTPVHPLYADAERIVTGPGTQAPLDPIEFARRLQIPVSEAQAIFSQMQQRGLIVPNPSAGKPIPLSGDAAYDSATLLTRFPKLSVPQARALATRANELGSTSVEPPFILAPGVNGERSSIPAQQQLERAARSVDLAVSENGEPGTISRAELARINNVRAANGLAPHGIEQLNEQRRNDFIAQSKATSETQFAYQTVPPTSQEELAARRQAAAMDRLRQGINTRPGFKTGQLTGPNRFSTLGNRTLSDEARARLATGEEGYSIGYGPPIAGLPPTAARLSREGPAPESAAYLAANADAPALGARLNELDARIAASTDTAEVQTLTAERDAILEQLGIAPATHVPTRARGAGGKRWARREGSEVNTGTPSRANYIGSAPFANEDDAALMGLARPGGTTRTPGLTGEPEAFAESNRQQAEALRANYAAQEAAHQAALVPGGANLTAAQRKAARDKVAARDAQFQKDLAAGKYKSKELGGQGEPLPPWVQTSFSTKSFKEQPEGWEERSAYGPGGELGQIGRVLTPAEQSALVAESLGGDKVMDEESYSALRPQYTDQAARLRDAGVSSKIRGGQVTKTSQVGVDSKGKPIKTSTNTVPDVILPEPSASDQPSLFRSQLAETRQLSEGAAPSGMLEELQAIPEGMRTATQQAMLEALLNQGGAPLVPYSLTPSEQPGAFGSGAIDRTAAEAAAPERVAMLAEQQRVLDEAKAAAGKRLRRSAISDSQRALRRAVASQTLAGGGSLTDAAANARNISLSDVTRQARYRIAEQLAPGSALNPALDRGDLPGIIASGMMDPEVEATSAQADQSAIQEELATRSRTSRGTARGKVSYSRSSAPSEQSIAYRQDTATAAATAAAKELAEAEAKEAAEKQALIDEIKQQQAAQEEQAKGSEDAQKVVQERIDAIGKELPLQQELNDDTNNGVTALADYVTQQTDLTTLETGRLETLPKLTVALEDQAKAQIDATDATARDAQVRSEAARTLISPELSTGSARTLDDVWNRGAVAQRGYDRQATDTEATQRALAEGSDLVASAAWREVDALRAVEQAILYVAAGYKEAIVQRAAWLAGGLTGAGSATDPFGYPGAKTPRVGFFAPGTGESGATASAGELALPASVEAALVGAVSRHPIGFSAGGSVTAVGAGLPMYGGSFAGPTMSAGGYMEGVPDSELTAGQLSWRRKLEGDEQRTPDEILAAQQDDALRRAGTGAKAGISRRQAAAAKQAAAEAAAGGLSPEEQSAREQQIFIESQQKAALAAAVRQSGTQAKAQGLSKEDRATLQEQLYQQQLADQSVLLSTMGAPKIAKPVVETTTDVVAAEQDEAVAPAPKTRKSRKKVIDDETSSIEANTEATTANTDAVEANVTAQDALDEAVGIPTGDLRLAAGSSEGFRGLGSAEALSAGVATRIQNDEAGMPMLMGSGGIPGTGMPLGAAMSGGGTRSRTLMDRLLGRPSVGPSSAGGSYYLGNVSSGEAIPGVGQGEGGVAYVPPSYWQEANDAQKELNLEATRRGPGLGGMMSMAGGGLTGIFKKAPRDEAGMPMGKAGLLSSEGSIANNAMGLGLMMTLFGSQVPRMLGVNGRTGSGISSMLQGGGAGLMFAPMLGIDPLIGLGIGASFGLKKLLPKGNAGSIVGDVGEGAAIGAGVGSIVPVVGTGLGAAVGAIGGLTIGLMSMRSGIDKTTQKILDLGSSAQKLMGRLPADQQKRDVARASVFQDKSTLDADRSAVKSDKTALANATKGTQAYKVAIDNLNAAESRLKVDQDQLKNDTADLGTIQKQVANDVSGPALKLKEQLKAFMAVGAAAKSSVPSWKAITAANKDFGVDATKANQQAEQFAINMRNQQSALKTSSPALSKLAGELADYAQKVGAIPTLHTTTLLLQAVWDQNSINVALQGAGIFAQSIQNLFKGGPVDPFNAVLAGDKKQQLGYIDTQIGQLQLKSATDVFNPKAEKADQAAIALLQKQRAQISQTGSLANNTTPPTVGQAQYVNGVWVGSDGKPIKDQSIPTNAWTAKHGYSVIPSGAKVELKDGIAGKPVPGTGPVGYQGASGMPQAYTTLMAKGQADVALGRPGGQAEIAKATAEETAYWTGQEKLARTQEQKQEVYTAEGQLGNATNAAGTKAAAKSAKSFAEMLNSLKDKVTNAGLTKGTTKDDKKALETELDFLNKTLASHPTKAIAHRATVARAAVEKQLGALGITNIVPDKVRIAYEQALAAAETSGSPTDLIAQRNILKKYVTEKHTPKQHAEAEKKLHQLNQEIKDGTGGWGKVIGLINKEIADYKHAENTAPDSATRLKAATQVAALTKLKETDLAKGGSSLKKDPAFIALENAYAKAQQTTYNTNDDVKALSAEQKFLKNYIADHKGAPALQLTANKLLASIDKKLAALHVTMNKQLQQLEQTFLQEQQNIEDQYASNVYSPGSGPVININQHFPHAPTPDAHREAIMAKHAAKAAFDGGFGAH